MFAHRRSDRAVRQCREAGVDGKRRSAGGVRGPVEGARLRAPGSCGSSRGDAVEQNRGQGVVRFTGGEQLLAAGEPHDSLTPVLLHSITTTRAAGSRSPEARPFNRTPNTAGAPPLAIDAGLPALPHRPI